MFVDNFQYDEKESIISLIRLLCYVSSKFEHFKNLWKYSKMKVPKCLKKNSKIEVFKILYLQELKTSYVKFFKKSKSLNDQFVKTKIFKNWSPQNLKFLNWYFRNVSLQIWIFPKKKSLWKLMSSKKVFKYWVFQNMKSLRFKSFMVWNL